MTVIVLRNTVCFVMHACTVSVILYDMYIQEIYVRDCVAIKAGSGKDEKPYVAKIGSIWQEPGNIL